jgi:hypothetical protein
MIIEQSSFTSMRKGALFIFIAEQKLYDEIIDDQSDEIYLRGA